MADLPGPEADQQEEGDGWGHDGTRLTSWVEGGGFCSTFGALNPIFFWTPELAIQKWVSLPPPPEDAWVGPDPPPPRVQENLPRVRDPPTHLSPPRSLNFKQKKSGVGQAADLEGRCLGHVPGYEQRARMRAWQVFDQVLRQRQKKNSKLTTPRKSQDSRNRQSETDHRSCVSLWSAVARVWESLCGLEEFGFPSAASSERHSLGIRGKPASFASAILPRTRKGWAYLSGRVNNDPQ